MSLGTVLVVDDDSSIRDTVRMILSRVGYNVLLAADGEQALQLMKIESHASKVNALLSDLEMPNVSGSQLIGQFKTLYPLIPIVILSGASDFVLTEVLMAQGITDWLRKPATREKLLEKVRVAVRLHEQRTRPGAT